MEPRIARIRLEMGFVALYTSHRNILIEIIECCRTVRGEPWADDTLDRYERAERGDFGTWLHDSYSMNTLAWYAVHNGYCDIIEKYAPLWSPHTWNCMIAYHYKPSLYPTLGTVMPLSISIGVTSAYIHRGLHREVAVHIIGRKDINGETITLSRVAEHARNLQTLRNLEEIGLDLSDPMLLYKKLISSRGIRCQRAIITLLQDKCTRLDEIMPNGKTLREMLLF
jgi:hypothetical protein